MENKWFVGWGKMANRYRDRYMWEGEVTSNVPQHSMITIADNN
jgi:hypothetical protein